MAKAWRRFTVVCSDSSREENVFGLEGKFVQEGPDRVFEVKGPGYSDVRARFVNPLGYRVTEVGIDPVEYGLVEGGGRCSEGVVTSR